MNVIEDYIINNERYLDSLNFNKSDNEIEIYFSKPNIVVILDKKALSNLLKGKLIDNISQFKYYNHFGFTYDNYAEFFIGNDSNFLYELYGNNTSINLSFKIAGY